MALLQTRLLNSHFGRTLRALREDEIAARSYASVSTAIRRSPLRSAASEPG
jgi:ABC-type branched-subunit amino acid transport system permease subunit